LWEVATGQEKWKANGHTGPVLSVAFAPDARQALSGGEDKAVHLWDVATGEDKPFEKVHTEKVWLVCFEGSMPLSPSADKVARRDPKTSKVRMVTRRDLITGTGTATKPDTLPGKTLGPPTLVPTDAGNFALSGWGTSTLEVYQGANLVAQLSDHGGPIRVMALSADGKRALTYADDKQVRLWDVMKQRLVDGFPWAPQMEVSCAALLPDGQHALF